MIQYNDLKATIGSFNHVCHHLKCFSDGFDVFVLKLRIIRSLILANYELLLGNKPDLVDPLPRTLVLGCVQEKKVLVKGKADRDVVGEPVRTASDLREIILPIGSRDLNSKIIDF